MLAVIMFFGGLFLAAAVLSFNPADPPSGAVYPPNYPVRNWCGTIGAQIAYHVLAAIGDAAYPMLLFLLSGAFLWIAKSKLEDKIFRIVGAMMLVLTVSVASAMMAVEARLPEGNGGILGLSIWMFLEPRLGKFGAWLLLAPVTIVGLLLLADTWLIILPVAAYKWLRDRARGPSMRLAEAAVATAGAAGTRLFGAVGALGTAAASVGGGGGTAVAQREEEAPPKPTARKQRKAKTDDDAPDADGTDANKAREDGTAKDAATKAAEPADGDAGGEKNSRTPTPPARAIVIRNNRPATQPDEADEDFAFTPLASTPRNQDYQLPSVDILEDPDYTAKGEDEGHMREQAVVLAKTLKEFGIEAEVVAIETGPVVTQYEIALAPGIKVGKVIALADDIAISLKAPNVRIVAPLPNKDTIGVEVPNAHRLVVRLKEIVLAAKEASDRMGLPLFLGKDATGDPLVKDLAGMPHLLIAGTTGSGKSVCLNTIIMSLLLTRTPDDLRMVLIDPKMVELSVFNRLPHLLCPVVNDMRKAEAILGWLVEKMEERYRTLSQASVRNIASYNRLTREEIIEKFKPASPEQEAKLMFHMPHICVIVDELADLMMVAAKEVEGHVTRLAQKSRAVGIHLVMATQRPSVDVLTGLIKSNLPVRISFQVTTRIDSRTILDSMGAEKLLGQGDMLFMVPGASKFIRAQGAYISDTDIQKLLDFIATTSEPDFQRELVQIKTGDEEGDLRDVGDLQAYGADDDLYNQSVEIVLEHERGSVSLLQRRLGIGYGRAARLIDQMAEDGIVGEYKGSQAREILLTLDQWNAMKQQRRQDENADSAKLTDDEASLDT
jgi:S-DNA-T family DNA segregation ATPase FtsK/SpoIIIE